MNELLKLHHINETCNHWACWLFFRLADNLFRKLFSEEVTEDTKQDLLKYSWPKFIFLFCYKESFNVIYKQLQYVQHFWLHRFVN